MSWGMLTGSKSGGAKFGASLRRALVQALLVVFFAQGFVVQSHFHPIPGSVQTQADAAKNTVKYGVFDVRVSDRDTRAPLHHDNDNCPICVQAAFAGTFLGNGPNAIAPPSTTVATIFFADASRLDGRLVALGWQSRAPPSA